MADDLEKTEEPTPKKLEDARKEGNIAKSIEVSGFVVLLVAAVVLIFYLKYVTFYLEEFFRYYLSFIGSELTKNRIFGIILRSAYYFFILMAPIFIAL